MAMAGLAKERRPNSPSAQRQAESSSAWGHDLGRVVTAEVICLKMTAGRGEVLLRIWTVTSGDPESCPQEAPMARQLLRAAEWYVGIVMMIIERTR